MIDRFDTLPEIIYGGKKVVIAKDGSSLHGYVVAKDPMGNEYFAYEGTTKSPGDNGRGEGLIWMALIEELKSK